MKRNHCRIDSYDIPGDGLTVKVTRYSKDEPSDRSLLLYPPTGGTNVADRSNAKYLCNAGFDVYILNDWSGRDEKSVDLEIHHRLYDRSRRATAAVLEQIKSPFIGILGTSVGATYAAVVTNLIEEIDAVFVVVGGASMPSIIAHSDQKAMTDLKKERFKKFGFKSDAEYQAAIDRVFPLDPPKTPPLYKKKITGMLLSTVDTTVPAADQLALKELWKPQTVYELKSGHFFSIIKSWLFYQKEITQFFIDAANKSV